MADRKELLNIAKTLAKANSDSPNEAAIALRATYKRMAQAGVSIEDLLTLPDEVLYQEALVKLVDVILDNVPDISAPTRRKYYAQYMALISKRFSEPSEEAGDRSREEEARAYEERRRQQEQQNGNTRSKQQSEKEYKRQNSETPKQENIPEYIFASVPIPFSPTAIVGFLFGRYSFFRCIISYPVRAIVLGFFSAVAGLVLSMLIYAALLGLKDTYPDFVNTLMSLFFSFENSVPLFTIALMFLVAYWKYEAGWFPIRPYEGENDFDTAIRAVWDFSVAIVILLCNFVYQLFFRIAMVLRNK